MNNWWQINYRNGDGGNKVNDRRAEMKHADVFHHSYTKAAYMC